METGGAPLKPWELANKPQSSLSSPDAPEEKEERQPLTQPTPSYTPYTRLSAPYGTPYQTPSYGTNYGSYYGYPSYGGSMYGTNYGSYGGMYGYGRPTPWSSPPLPNVGEMPGSGSRSPPIWQRFLDGLQKIVHCFGRVTFLVDENTQAFHFFITALLTFLDKAGSLYGEIARFVMKLLGFRRRSRTLSTNKKSSERAIDPTDVFKNVWKK